MGLTALLHRLASTRPHVLLLPCPGSDATRVEAERVLRERGWVIATSPADADALLVLGDPGPELAVAAERVWEQLPGPRVRLAASDIADVEAVLAGLGALLQDRAAQTADARDRGDGPHGSGPAAEGDHDMGGMDMGGMDMSGHDMSGMDMGGMDMGGMDLPGGLAMADRGEDRDGLTLDVLHEQLGPALPAWPAGLVLDAVLQGDVLTSVRARVLPAAAPTPAWEPDPVVHRLDRLAAVLSVAGADHLAVRARRLRDELLAGSASAEDAGPLLRRVAGSRSLRLLGRDLPTGLGHDLATHLRLLCTGAVPAPVSDLDALADAVTGLDLGSARLVVAALAPDTAALMAEAPA